MNSHTIEEQARKRLRILLAHFMEHMDCHVNEIQAQRPGLQTDLTLDDALTQAVDDMRTVRHSLAVALVELGEGAVDHHGHHHDHGHGSHDHGTAWRR